MGWHGPRLCNCCGTTGFCSGTYPNWFEDDFGDASLHSNWSTSGTGTISETGGIVRLSCDTAQSVVLTLPFEPLVSEDTAYVEFEVASDPLGIGTMLLDWTGTFGDPAYVRCVRSGSSAVYQFGSGSLGGSTPTPAIGDIWRVEVDHLDRPVGPGVNGTKRAYLNGVLKAESFVALPNNPSRCSNAAHLGFTRSGSGVANIDFDNFEGGWATH